MSRILDISANFLLGCGLALAMFVPFSVAHAQNYKVLYNFQGSDSGGPDGAQPDGGLIADKAGNLYGVTQSGGASGYGTVFELGLDGTESVLHSFTFGNNGEDGIWPAGALLEDKAGNLYGATISGGAAKCGTIFELAPDGIETVLYAFKGGSDGCNPPGSLIADRHGNLYGSTLAGGNGDFGTIFKLSPDGKETLLHVFAGGNDGETPMSPLIFDNTGNLYGTTAAQGIGTCYEDCGTVFELAPDGTETILYTFCTQVDCPDGSDPEGGLIADSAGNLYGTTNYNGAKGGGTVFELGADGTETSLYSFGFYGSDGSFPRGTLVADGKGDLYGVTWSGGGRGCKGTGCGNIFKVTPGGTETVLHDFKQTAGDDPTGSLISINGYLYGTTESGGSSINCGTNHKGVPYGCGTVFAIKK